MKQELEFKKVRDNKDLVSDTTYNCINSVFSEAEKNDFFVAEINPDYYDGIMLFDNYEVGDRLGVNCLICECKRNAQVQYAALLVPTGYKYSMSTTVRKYTNSRMVSVAPLDYVLEKTKMEYGSINPVGLPNDWKIFIDPKVLEKDIVICGSGLKKSKISFPSKYLLKLNNVEILDDLAK